MPKLLLSGDWNSAGEMILGLLQAGFRLEFAPASCIEGQAGLQLSAVSAKADFPAATGRWLAWLRVDDPALTLAAYQAGAQAVFPPDMPPALLVQALLGLQTGNSEPGGVERPSSQHQIRRGDPVFLEADTVLTIHEGILATTMVHGDGAEVLLGLTGAGQILVAHPDDECFIQVLAHTPVVVSVQSWEQAAAQPGFAEKLRTRLQRMEAWAAMQARPYLDQRVLGILSLLAEQFGVSHTDGTLIAVRLTHAQLAAAGCANPTTNTRLVGGLRTRGKISLGAGGKQEFFVLRSGVEVHHH
jgi:CRP-like cAMP-binding protein